jgi:hypothetical protein
LDKDNRVTGKQCYSSGRSAYVYRGYDGRVHREGELP